MEALLKTRRRILANHLRGIFSNRWEMLKFAGVLAFVAVLMSCLHWGFSRTLGYINGTATIGPLLMQKILEIAFLSTFSLIALSAMVASLAVHFGSSDLEFLLATPLSRMKIFMSKSLEASLHASWMVILVLIPFLAVYGRLKHLDAGFFILAFFCFFPLTASASSLGIAASTLFVCGFPRRKLMEFLSVLGVVVFVLVYAGVRLTLPHKLANPDQMQEVFEYVLYLQTPAASYLPSKWYVSSLNAYTAQNWEALARSSIFLILFALLSLAFLYLVARLFLTPAKWALVLEGAGSQGRVDENTLGPSLANGPRALFARNAMSTNGVARSQAYLWGLLFLKELRFFFRDSQRFSNASFILAVCAIYLVSIYRLPMDTPYLKNFLSFINLALGLFIISALSLRFCFPQPSLEMAYAWILRASPLSASDFLGSKFVFNLIFLSALGTVLVILSPVFLGTDLRLIPIYMAAAFVCSNVLAAMALGVGSAFPKKHFENVIQIETSFGGFLYAMCSLAYVGFTLAVFAWPIRYYFQVNYLKRTMDGGDWLWLSILGGAYLAVSAALILGNWVWAKKSWARAV